MSFKILMLALLTAIGVSGCYIYDHEGRHYRGGHYYQHDRDGYRDHGYRDDRQREHGHRGW